MKIWTIQSIDMWEKLKEEKIVTCDETLASYLNGRFNSSGEYIQGTFWELRFNEVKKAQIFEAR